MPGETEERGAGREGAWASRRWRAQGLGLTRGALWPPTYRGAASRAGSSCPPAPGRLGPRTSSSQWLRGTGWARSVRTRHTRGRTARAAGVAVGPPPPPSPGCALARAGSGFSPLLLETSKGHGSCHRTAQPAGAGSPRPTQDAEPLAHTGFRLINFRQFKTSLLFNRFSGQDYIYIFFSLLGNVFFFSVFKN